MAIFGNKKIKVLEQKISVLEKRDIFSVAPLSLISGLGIPYTSNFETRKNLTLSAYWCGLNKISDSIATLDLKVYSVDEQGFKSENYIPAFDLLTICPNARTDKYNFWKTAVCNMYNNGNFYVYILRNPLNFYDVQELQLIHSNTISKIYIDGQKKWKISGFDSLIDDSNIVHIINFPDPDDPEIGISTLQYSRMSMESIYNAEVHSSEFLKNGANSNVYIQSESNPSDEQVVQIQSRWRAAYNILTGKKDIPIVPYGMTVHTTGVSPKEAQLIESRMWNITEVSRWLNISPVFLYDNGKQLAGNIEAMQLEYLNTTLQPLLQKIQNAFATKLILPKDRRKILLEWDLQDLIKMNNTEQMDYYTKGLQNGLFSVNDVRKKIGSVYAEGGDENYITVQQQNLKYPVVINANKDNNLKK
jgi:HK97 family phage portal protein